MNNNFLLEAAGKYLQTAEVPGNADNPKIRKMFKDSVGTESPDSVPWCAAFVGAVLKDCGLKGTGRLNARSYLNWGIPTVYPEPGDLAIFWRGKKDGWQGHVGFVVKKPDDGKVLIRGGNQSDAVNDTYYATSRLLGYRRAERPVQPVVAEKKVGNKAVATGVGIVSGGIGLAVYRFFDSIKGWFNGLF